MTQPRTLPHSLEAEDSLVGAMLLAGGEALERIAGIVSPNDCYSPRVQILLDAGLQLQTRGAPIDTITLEAELRAEEKLGRVGGVEALAELAGKVPTLENIEYYARIVRDRAQLRRLIRVCAEAASRAYTEHGNADEIVQETSDALQDCFSSELGGRGVQEVLKRLIDVAGQRTDLIAQGRESELEALGVPTGLAQFDSSLTYGGLPTHQPTVLGADTSTGKSAAATTFMWNCARSSWTDNAGTQRPGSCLYCTLEDDAESPTLRIVASLSRINNAALQNLRVRPEEWERFQHACGEIWNKQIHFFERPMPVNELVGRVKRFVRRHKTRLVVVDYLQLLQPAERLRTGQEEVDATFGALVDMAIGMPETATLIVSQFHRRDRMQRPTRADFYHSAKIEHGAHTVLLLWDPPLARSFRAKLGIIDKQKQGPSPCEVVLGWEPKSATFFNADAAEAEAYYNAVKLATGGKRPRAERTEKSR